MSIIVQPLGQMCTVERKYFDIHEAISSKIEQWFSPNTEACISMCCARRANIDCKSIIYNKKESTCLFLNSAFQHYMSIPSTVNFDSELYVIYSCGNVCMYTSILLNAHDAFLKKSAKSEQPFSSSSLGFLVMISSRVN
ncbi:PAN domain protein, partial [Trichinella nativa]